MQDATERNFVSKSQESEVYLENKVRSNLLNWRPELTVRPPLDNVKVLVNLLYAVLVDIQSIHIGIDKTQQARKCTALPKQRCESGKMLANLGRLLYRS